MTNNVAAVEMEQKPRPSASTPPGEISSFDGMLRAYMDASGLVDAARCRPASQSSLSAWSNLDEANAAVNGRFPVDFAFHTALEQNPWWQVDLGWEYPIEFIVIHNRRLGEQERADQVEISVSNDGLSWTLVHQGCVRFGAGPEGRPLLMPTGIRARHVRIMSPGTTYLHLSQVEVLVRASEQRLRDIAELIEAGRCASPGEPVVLGVVGTSNSLMVSGYTAGLRDHPGFSLQANLSLGSSHATLVPFRWDDALIDQCRVVFFDLNVNQQLAIACGIWPEALERQIFLDILARCARCDVMPIFVTLPERWADQIGAAVAADHREGYVALCNEYGIPFFNGYRFLEWLSFDTTIPVDEFLKDPAHIDHRLRRHFGSLLAAGLQQALPRLRLMRRIVPVEEMSYAPIGLANDAGLLTFINKTNSLLYVDFLLLIPGMQVRLPIPEGTSVVGIVFNMSGSNAGLRITGRNTTLKNVNTPHADGGKTFLAVSWCLLNSVRATPDGVTLECVFSGDLHAMEANDHGNTPHDVSANHTVEIAGLVLSHSAVERTLSTYSPDAIDLWQAAVGRIAPSLPPWPSRLPLRTAQIMV